MVGNTNCPESGTVQNFTEHNDIPQMIVSYNNVLGLNVSQGLKNKIINGQYVDLAKMFVNSNEPQKQNFQGSCLKAPCSYLHQCIKCNAQHPLAICPKKEQMQSSRGDQPFRSQGSNRGYRGQYQNTGSRGAFHSRGGGGRGIHY